MQADALQLILGVKLAQHITERKLFRTEATEKGETILSPLFL